MFYMRKMCTEENTIPNSWLLKMILFILQLGGIPRSHVGFREQQASPHICLVSDREAEGARPGTSEKISPLGPVICLDIIFP